MAAASNLAAVDRLLIAKNVFHTRIVSVAIGMIAGLHFTLAGAAQAWIGSGDWGPLTYACFVALLIPSLISSRKRVTPIDVAVVLYVTLYILRLAWAQQDEEDFFVLIGLYGAGLAACYIVLSRFLSSTPHTDLFVWVFCVTLALGSALISADLMVTETGRSILAANPDSNPVGLSVALVSSALVALAITFAVLRNDRSRLLVRLAIGAVAAGFAVFFAWQALATGTRSVFLALGGAFLFLMALLPKKKHLSSYGIILVIGCVAAAMLWLIIPLVADLVQQLMPGPTGRRLAEFLGALRDADVDGWIPSDRAASERTWLWRTYWDCFVERPLWGCGPRLGEVSRAPIYAHNVILAAAGELGVLGLGALGVAVAFALLSARVLVRDEGAAAWVATALLVGGFLQLQFSLELPVAKHFVVGLALVEGLRTRRARARRVLATRRPRETKGLTGKEGETCGTAASAFPRSRWAWSRP